MEFKALFKNYEYKEGMLVKSKTNNLGLTINKTYVIEKVFIFSFRKSKANFFIKVNNIKRNFHPNYFGTPIEAKSGVILYG